MAAGWLTVLKSVPWDVVIRNAPRVANEAKKLWNIVAKKENPSEISDINPDNVSGENKSIEEMSDRIAVLEADVSRLNSQMLASSQLIKDLADQNTQLIRRIETNRKRMMWMTVLSISAVIIAIISVILAIII